MKEQDYRITNSEEYKQYIKALCHLASGYISQIRVQFAEQAYDMYANETIRSLVLAYGEEYEKREARRLRDFSHVSQFGAVTDESLEDSVLNNTHEYAEAIKFLFKIH